MITAVILTRNEEKNIKRCISSVAFCDEILVIDDKSTDNTEEIVLKNKAKFISHELSGNFSQQRNFALSIAKNEWILFVDADEVVNERLRDEIVNGVRNDNINGYCIRRQDYMFGRKLKYGELRNKKFIRLGRKNTGNWVGAVHESWNIHGSTAALLGELSHYPHQTLSEFLADINLYTTLRAEELYKNGSTASIFSILAYTKAKFIQTYFIKAGFMDGTPGLIFSLCMSFHSFLVRSKLYILSKKRS